jgi:hypothetical protein
MIKRLFLAAALAAFSFPAMSQTLPGSTILKPISGSYRMPYDATSRRITSAFTSEAEVVRVVCTTACFVQAGISGSTPVALAGGVTSSTYIPADKAEYIQVPRGGRMSVIRLSSDGVLYVQEFGR